MQQVYQTKVNTSLKNIKYIQCQEDESKSKINIIRSKVQEEENHNRSEDKAK